MISFMVKSSAEFMDTSQTMLDHYFEEVFGAPFTQETKDMALLELKDKDFFELVKNNEPIGFGAYKNELYEEKPTFMLYEFYIEPKHRDVEQLFKIKKDIVTSLQLLDVAMWMCCFDENDPAKGRAYEGLGFEPLFTDEDHGLIYMGMPIEGL